MRKLIVVIEQSPTIAYLLDSYLRKEHQVIVRSTPEAALNLFSTIVRTPDVIFLAVDAQRQVDYYQFITFLKGQNKYRDTMLIVMVGREEQAAAERRLARINVRYLLKPFKIEDAVALVWADGPGVSAPYEA